MYGIEEEKLAEHSLEAQGRKSSGCDKECVCQKSWRNIHWKPKVVKVQGVTNNVCVREAAVFV